MAIPCMDLEVLPPAPAAKNSDKWKESVQKQGKKIIRCVSVPVGFLGARGVVGIL